MEFEFKSNTLALMLVARKVEVVVVIVWHQKDKTIKKMKNLVKEIEVEIKLTVKDQFITLTKLQFHPPPPPSIKH